MGSGFGSLRKRQRKKNARKREHEWWAYVLWKLRKHPLASGERWMAPRILDRWDVWFIAP